MEQQVSVVAGVVSPGPSLTNRAGLLQRSLEV